MKCMTISELFLADFETETLNTRKILVLVPDVKSEWKPHEKSMKFGYLAWHTAELASWALEAARSEGLDIPAGFKPEIPDTMAEVLVRFDANVAAAKEATARVSDEAWSAPWTLSLAGKPIFTQPRHTVWRGMCLNHMIHHRAQLGAYLRLNGIAIPGMYGPSADEQIATAQGQS